METQKFPRNGQIHRSEDTTACKNCGP